MRHRYTRQELESITRETPIYLEGAGIAQLQWGGLEIAEGVRDGYLYCKHIKPFAMELYDKYWTAWDGPPEEGTLSHADDIRRNFSDRQLAELLCLFAHREEEIDELVEWLRAPAKEDTWWTSRN